MIKYNHTHLPAKRHTGLFKPCYGGNNGKITVRPLDFLHTLEADFCQSIKRDFSESIKKSKTDFCDPIKKEFLDTLENFRKLQFKRLPKNGATANILGVIKDFSEQYAHARSKSILDFLNTPRASTFFNIGILTNSMIEKSIRDFSEQYTHARDKLLSNSAFQMRNSINALTNSDNEGYYKDLSKSNSGQPFRNPLAFFVLKNWYGSQPNQLNSTKQITQQGKTVIPMVSKLPPYDGLTLQNKKAFWRICRAVSVRTESKTRYLNFKVAITHNLTGGNHA